MIKMKLDVRKILFIFIMTIFSLSFLCVERVYANDDYSISTCEFSEAYIEWTKLSDEDKKNSIQPPMCDYSLTETNRLQSNILESFNSFNRTKLPVKYDIRDTDKKRVIKNQKSTGQCWAFATTTALEIFTKISLGEDWVYSPRHIEYATSRVFKDNKINEWGFNREVGTGGHVFFSSGYLMSQVGPVFESDMPFEDNENIIDINEIDKEPVLDVNGLTIDGLNRYAPCNSDIITNMKNKILEKGSVVSSLYFTHSTTYYNSTTSSLYYNGRESANHSITIVGWDDNYAVTNFSPSNRPSSPGAWIIQNSWGETEGDNGYNYVSYLDERICTIYMSIDDVDTEFEDNSYIYDKLGHNVSMGYTAVATQEKLKNGYGMAVYEKANKAESLKEVTIGTAGVGKYKIYYSDGDASKSSLSKMTLIGEGNTNSYGYLTHKFDNPLLISSDVTKFSIAVYWELTSNFSPIPVTALESEDYKTLETNSGETFISPSGVYWEDCYSNGCVVSIKAFTDDLDYSLKVQLNEVSNSNNEDVNVSLNFTATNVIKEKISMTVKDSDNKVVNNVDVTYQLGSNNEVKSANLKFNDSLKNGTYYIDVYYDNNFITRINFLVAVGLYSSVYQIDTTDKTIYLYSSVDINTFLRNVNGESGKVKKNGVEVTSGYVGTGMRIDGYVIILRGDVTGDGFIKVNDVMKISKYTVEGTGLEDKYFKAAADVTNDGFIKVNDVMKISKYTVEGGTL